MFNLKILYAEDDAQSRESYMVVLEHYFKEVIEASNGQEALELYKVHKPDIILTDINMPLLDGLELITAIRKNDKQTAVIVLSAYADSKKLLKAIPLGLSEYLIKPIEGSEFIKKLLAVATEIKPQHQIDLSHDYVFDKSARILLRGEEKIILTKHEYEFLLLLAKYMPHIASNEILADTLWKEDAEFCVARVQSLVMRLRKKAPDLIELVYGFGYKIKQAKER